MKSVKVFPKTRICVVDVYPSFVEGLKKAIKFSEQHNIRLNTPDGKRLIVGFCLESINQAFKNTQSMFPKVICMSANTNNEKIKSFIENYFDKIINKLPVPYCGQILLDSPDLERAAEACLGKEKSQRSFRRMVDSLDLRRIN